MSCFCCFGSRHKDVGRIENNNGNRPGSQHSTDSAEDGRRKESRNGARSFTFYDLAIARKTFDEVNWIGKGGFGKVYKGRLKHRRDVDPSKEALSWSSRMKIALGAARGLEYLHCKASLPVIYRDLKLGNILLAYDFNPKLSDFGLAKLDPVGEKSHVSTRRMGTYGYCAPEYARSGKLTFKSDIYSFGVVLLELITGRKAIDLTRKVGVQDLVLWLSRPYLRDRRKYAGLADPLLQGRFPVLCLQHVVSIVTMCLQDPPSFRPLISGIVVGLQHLSTRYQGPLSHQPHQPSKSTPRMDMRCF